MNCTNKTRLGTNLTRVLDHCNEADYEEDTLLYDQDLIQHLTVHLISVSDTLLPETLATSPTPLSDNATFTSDHVKLPQLELPHFSRNSNEWNNFINLLMPVYI